MKLIDILARELKVWPEGIVTAVQDHDGEIKFYNSPIFPMRATDEGYFSRGLVWIREGDEGDSFLSKIGIAIDWDSAIVTQAQWQAAVDALAAQDMHDTAVKAQDRDGFYGCESVSADFNYATLTASACDAHCKVVSKEWNGEGLPPVGLDVYVDHTHAGGGLTAVKILAHTQARKLQCAVYQAGDEVSYASSGCFKPIPTDEQIAAEERDAEIKDLMIILGKVPSAYYKDIAEAIQKAGYRKQVAK